MCQTTIQLNRDSKAIGTVPEILLYRFADFQFIYILLFLQPFKAMPRLMVTEVAAVVTMTDSRGEANCQANLADLGVLDILVGKFDFHLASCGDEWMNLMARHLELWFPMLEQMCL